MTRKASRTKPKSTPSPALGHENDQHVKEVINLDDTCPICHGLLYKPVKTRCNHTMCESCMNLWAEISINQEMAVVGLEDEPITLHPSQMEIKCPMCRTLSTGVLDQDREALLRATYPQTYALREKEEQTRTEDDFADSVETLTLYIGNTHQLVKQDSEQSRNKHGWTFFVRPSRTDLIEEVHIFLVRVERLTLEIDC